MDLLFDLDGTLTDSGAGITRCIQHAMSRLGREPGSGPELARFVGPPLRDAFAELLLTDDPQIISGAIAFYRERYVTEGMFENVVYPSVTDGLAELSADGHRLWVVTSKPRVYARQIIDHFGLSSFFSGVRGAELDGTNADKAELIRAVLDHDQIKASEAWMIGDRAQDIRGGRANGLRTAAALWGYGSEDELRGAEPDLLIGNISELRVHLGVPDRIAERTKS
ncbi:MAG: phosphoglycolate phosphatase [Blastocatellia bacterium]|jgi:phosphoglycolate phosphatase|nr:phosphoglycolate phosphatase [Blastocatellia bacterium]